MARHARYAFTRFVQLLHRVPAAGVSHVISPGIIRILVNHSQVSMFLMSAQK